MEFYANINSVLVAVAQFFAANIRDNIVLVLRWLVWDPSFWVTRIWLRHAPKIPFIGGFAGLDDETICASLKNVNVGDLHPEACDKAIDATITGYTIVVLYTLGAIVVVGLAFHFKDFLVSAPAGIWGRCCNRGGGNNKQSAVMARFATEARNKLNEELVRVMLRPYLLHVVSNPGLELDVPHWRGNRAMPAASGLGSVLQAAGLTETAAHILAGMRDETKREVAVARLRLNAIEQ